MLLHQFLEKNFFTSWILAIESSCDDSSVALFPKSRVEFPNPTSLPQYALTKDSNKEFSSGYSFMRSYSSEQELAPWGGVVPELAARNHVQKLPLLTHNLLTDLQKAFKNFSNDSSQKSSSKTSTLTLGSSIQTLAVTTQPGLMGPLLTGITFIQALSFQYQLPIIPVHHLMAHLDAIFLTEKQLLPQSQHYLGVLLSGGHGLFSLNSQINHSMLPLASTRDDAPGEAFDKGGKLLGLNYPAGKIIDQLSIFGDPKAFRFPIGLEHQDTADMSFSGVKTALRLFLEDRKLNSNLLQQESHRQLLCDICASYQEAIIQAIIKKLDFLRKPQFLQILKNQSPSHPLLLMNPKEFQSLPIVVGGGVACNRRLRESMKKHFPNIYFVSPIYCTDNAMMVAHYSYRYPERLIPYPECLNSLKPINS